MSTLHVVAHRHRPGGGFVWSIDTVDRHVQAGPLLVSRCRQPDGAPMFDQATVAQNHDEGDKGWTRWWTGWAIRPLGIAVTVPEFGMAGSALRRVRAWRQARANRSTYGRVPAEFSAEAISEDEAGDVPDDGTADKAAPFHDRMPR